MAERRKKQGNNQFAEITGKKQTPAPLATPPRVSAGGRGKHIGGYYDPAIARQVKALAVEEDTTVQELVAEALDLLFQTRGRPTIAKQPSENEA